MSRRNNNKVVTLMMPNSIYQILRKNIDLTSVLGQKMLPKYLYIINLIAEKMLYSKEEYESSGAIINSKLLNHIFGGDSSRKYFQKLKEWKIIKVQTLYKIGEKSYGYKFFPELESEEICFCKIDIIRHNSWLNKTLRAPKFPIKKIEDYQLKILLDDITISKEALDLMANRYYGFEEEFDTFKQGGHTIHFSLSTIHGRDISLVSLLLGDMWVYRDMQMGSRSRLYSSLTSLYKGYRKFLFLDNKPLYAIDITASQLVFGILIIEKEIRKKTSQLPEDFVKFTELILNGTIYDFFAQGLGIIEKGEVLEGEDRTTLKKKYFMEIWYGDIYQKAPIKGMKGKYESLKGKYKSFNRGTAQILKSNFPSVFNALLELKKDNYTDFPILLQNLEAKFLLDNIGRKLMKSGVKFLTIHDSILVNNLDTLRSIEDMMKEEFQKVFGFVPNFKIEVCSDLAKE